MSIAARRIARATAWVCAFLLLSGAAGACWQWLRARDDALRYPPPGRLVTVDGARMHLDCRGTGRPLLLLEAGLTSGTSSWMRVHDALARTTEVCAYDRVGIGWSDPSDAPRTPAAVAVRLHRLVGAAGLDGPYVLLGMSAGGVFVREYHARFPQQVIGMVLVDSSHEQQLRHLPSAAADKGALRMLEACTWLQPLGVVRLLDVMAATAEGTAPDPRTGPLPAPGAVPAMVATLNRSHACTGLQAEMEGFLGALAAAPALRPMGDLPLLVLSQDTGRPLDPAMRDDPELAALDRALRQAWDPLQQSLARASTRGQRQVVHGSGHLIHSDRPQAMIDAVTRFVATLRATHAGIR